MKSIDKIPTSKLNRAASLVKTGAKVGANYISYYGEKLINPDLSTEKLDQNNAEDIYDGLKKMKGSALKVAQMLSMEKNVIPQAYAQEFSKAQYSVPPLSGPLVKKTFKKYFGENPEHVFDAFEITSHKAATIGQVHKAKKEGKDLAVKIQYPGVADSISSDLALVKPFAMRMFNIKGKDSDRFFKEVETKLIEETHYDLELKRGKFITEKCAHLPHMQFPHYFEELSNERIITMNWMYGQHLSEFTSDSNYDQSIAQKVGQALWDFYMYQIHRLKMVHADPHPGNFLITDEGQDLCVIDFGCIKEIPDQFYYPYFELTKSETLKNESVFIEHMRTLEILRDDDKPAEFDFFKTAFNDMLTVFAEPFRNNEFDFSNKDFFHRLASFGDKYANDDKIKSYNGNRGSEHLLYMNRTFFGLYNLLHDLGAKVKINTWKEFSY